MMRRTWNNTNRSIRSKVLGGWLVSVAALACCCSALGVSKSELIAEIEDRRAAIQDLDVEFVFYAVGAIPSHAVQRDARKVILKGSNKIFIDRDYRIDKTLFETTASLTGTRGWGHQSVNKRAYTRSGTDIPLVDTEGSGFFDLMMWYPCRLARTGTLHPNDLLSVLDSDDSEVLPQTEVINGHSCYVVQVLDAMDAAVARVWIDPEMGYLPVQQEYYTVCPAPTLVVKFVIDDAVEVIDDVWLPASGERITAANANVEELTNGLHYTMAVQSDASGLRLKVNQGVNDDVFDLSTKLPTRTFVSDLDTGQHWTARARDYSGAAETALASLSDSSWRTAGSHQQPRRPSPIASIAWVALMIAAGLSGAGLLSVRQRWFTR